MRPLSFISVRKRQALRLASHAFHAVDALFLTVLTVVVMTWVASGPLLTVPLIQVGPFVVAVLTLLYFLRTSGAYRFERSHPWLQQMGHVMVIALMAGAATSLVAWLVPEPEPTTEGALRWTGLAMAGLFVLHSGWWLLVRRWRRRNLLTPNIVLVGATRRAETLIDDAMSRRHINVLGFFDDRLERSPQHVAGVPNLGNTDALLTYRKLGHVDLIVVTVDPAATVRVRQIMNKLSVLPNPVKMMVEQDDETGRVAAVAQLADAPLAPLVLDADPGRKAISKRAQDLIIGSMMLLVALPLLALAALAVRLDSPGPIFFRQHRHGFNNEEILVWKFRSMRHEAADARAERQVSADDDRITRVGRFLRRSSLDELPQLLNVLRGEMALVGPRPHAIGMKTGEVQSAQLVADYAHRHRIKPGLTGWAAVNGSRGPLQTQADVKRRVALDVEYIEKQSLWLDLKILALTGPRLLGDRSTIR